MGFLQSNVNDYNQLIDQLMDKEYQMELPDIYYRLLKHILKEIWIPNEYESIIDALLMDTVNMSNGISVIRNIYKKSYEQESIKINKFYGLITMQAIDFYNEAGIKANAQLIDSYVMIQDDYIRDYSKFKILESWTYLLSDILNLLTTRKDLLTQVSINTRNLKQSI